MKTPGGRSSRLIIKNPQSQFTTERNGAMKFEIFLGNAQFQIPGILHCPPFIFLLEMNLILPIIKTIRKSMVFGLFKHKS